MGLFKALYIASQLLPNAEREIKILEKQWAKSNKKFKNHVDNCPKLRNWPNEQCDECVQVAFETRKTEWLWGMREQFRQLNTPSIEAEYTKEDLEKAAEEAWNNDPSLPPADIFEFGIYADRFFDSVAIHVFKSHVKKTLGHVTVRRGPSGLECETQEFVDINTIDWDNLWSTDP